MWRSSRLEFDLGRKVETSHRPRSFLFLTLAAAVAAAAGVEEIVIPENGLIALNPPLNASRVGTLSTRTAHPRFLSEFQSVVAVVGAFGGHICNPFMYMSKTDVIRRAPESVSTLLPSTLSCSHLGRNRWTGFRGHHCGYCIPCLYRRAAFHAIGLDSAADYYRDVFARHDNLSANERFDIRALTRFARRLTTMTAAQRSSIALSHGACDPSTLAHLGPDVIDPYVEWSEMLARWTCEFLASARALSSPDVRRRLSL